MFKIEKNVAGPSKADVSRMSRHSIMNATAQNLKPDESFEVVCADGNERAATMRALQRFKNKNGLDSLLIMKMSEKTFRVWGQ
jgi:hypothetical protein